MGNSLTVVDEHRRFLRCFGVSESKIKRINYIAFVDEYAKRIREETEIPLKKKMALREGEHSVIVMTFVFLHQYGQKIIKEFNTFMLNAGFRIYKFIPLRARYHMEYLKRIKYDFDEVLRKYMLPVPESVLVVSHSEEAESRRLPDLGEQLVPNQPDFLSLTPFDGPLEPYDHPEFGASVLTEETLFSILLEPSHFPEDDYQLWLAYMIRTSGFGFSEGVCVSNSLQDDERALGILERPISADIGTFPL